SLCHVYSVLVYVSVLTGNQGLLLQVSNEHNRQGKFIYLPSLICSQSYTTLCVCVCVCMCVCSSQPIEWDCARCVCVCVCMCVCTSQPTERDCWTCVCVCVCMCAPPSLRSGTARHARSTSLEKRDASASATTAFGSHL